MEQDLVGHAQLHAHGVLVPDMDFVIAFFLGKQLTVDDLIVQHHLCLDHVSLLTNLPHIERNPDHIALFLFLYHRLKEISHSLPPFPYFPILFPI